MTLQQEQRVERRLAAIFAADVAGYSRLMSQDETGTLHALAAARAVMDGFIAEHGGRIANTAGDSVLAEFPSAVNAVQCAVAVQEGLGEANAEVPEDRRLQFRIGVHVGDVVVRGADLLGDGVNVAARLEGLAEPGGIAISGAAHGYVRKALPLVYADLGEQHVKNIDEPIRAYVVRAATPAAPASALKPLPLPEKPSIAVLPFSNMSSDPEQSFFGDGIAEDIITTLSHISSLLVIARNSTFAYKGKARDLRHVGRELGVRYILEGSVRRSGDRIRVTAQLVDASDGSHVWAERYDRPLADVFDIQDELTREIVTALRVALTDGEQARVWLRSTENVSAWADAMRGFDHIWRGNAIDNEKAREFFRSAVRRDPQYARACAMLAHTYYFDLRFGYTTQVDAAQQSLTEYSVRALSLDPQEPYAITVHANCFWLSGRFEEGVNAARRATEISPKMMEKDEEGTLRRVKALQREVIEPKVRERGGRLVKTTGDGFLCEFGSPVEAVRCALEVQDAAHRNRDQPDGGLLLRMGINLGDIIVEPDGDIYGEGVNVAARLEQMADPGGICVSGSVHEHAEGKVPVVFENKGEQQVKNINRPVRIYALAGVPQARHEPKPLPLPDKPSIAVLPFTNMSGDSEQGYFADGVAEDIITALSKVSGFFVIARNSSFAYRAKTAEVRQIGRELGVRYVLEGSIRKSKNSVRLTGQLIDAETGHHIWADRFDGALNDIFALQDEVTARVVRALAPTLVRAEIERTKRKPTESLDAYEHFLRGLAVVYSGWTREARENAFQEFTRAIELDPQFARAYAGAAMIYVGRKDNNWMVDRPREFAEGLRLARRAVELGKEDALALCYGGWALVHLARKTEVGAPFIERALILDPNMTAARVYSAWLRIWKGEPQIAIERIAEAIRLSPLDPELHFWEIAMAHAYYHAEQYDEAVAWAEKAAAVDPTYVGGLRILAASYARTGRTQDAQTAVQKMCEIDPMVRVSNLRDAVGPYLPEGLARYEEGLRLAGLPE